MSKLSLSSLHHVVVVAVFTLHRAQEIEPSTSTGNNQDEDEECEEEEEEELVGEELEVYELTLGFLITVTSGKTRDLR